MVEKNEWEKRINDYIDIETTRGIDCAVVLKELHSALLYERNELVLRLNIVQQQINMIMEKTTYLTQKD